MNRGLDRKFIPLLLQGPCRDPKWGVWGGCALGWALLGGARGGQPRPSSPCSGQIVKKSCYPRWNETFEFELEEGAMEALCVEAWDWDLVSRNDFLGKVSAPRLPASPATTSEPGLHSRQGPQPPHLRLPQRGTPQNEPLVLRDPPEGTPPKGTVVGKEES